MKKRGQAMVLKRSGCIGLLIGLIFIVSSCGMPIMNKNISDISGPGLFENRYKMEETYYQVILNKTTVGDLKALGFDTHKAQQLGSIETYDLMYKGAPQTVINVNNFSEYKKTLTESTQWLIKEKQLYAGFLFQEEVVKGQESRFGIGKQEKKLQGNKYACLLIARNNVIIYKEYCNTPIDKSQKQEAFLQGIEQFTPILYMLLGSML